MRLKHFALAAGVLLASASIAAADTVTNPLNLRRGPGTGYGVIATMPPGSYVDVLECGGGWCRVAWRGIEGFASASYLAPGAAYAYVPPPPVYVVPPPVVSFGFDWGPRWRDHWRGRDRGHWGHGHYRRHR
jgi:uncharacterized protein YraI